MERLAWLRPKTVVRLRMGDRAGNLDTLPTTL